VLRAAVVVLAGGSGSRVGAGVNKVYLPLAGRRVVSWSLAWASQVPEVVTLVLVVRAEDVPLAEAAVSAEALGVEVRIVVGGSTRHASEDAALALLAPAVQTGELDVVAVHDGARPLAGPSLYGSVIRVADAVGGAVPVLPARGVLPMGADGQPRTRRPAAPPEGQLLVPGVGTPTSRLRLARVQTPQAFRARDLLAAYAAAHEAGFRGTDTASSIEAFSDLTVRTVPGSALNLKVTYPSDLVVAEHLLGDHRHRLL
jgi:2-C-methyl-D-erythritol 4-phosphate cytidylyltransferase